MNRLEKCTVGDLLEKGIIEQPLDGNHGDVHPKGRDFTESGIPFIMASDIKNGVINFKSCKFISKEQADSLRIGFAKTGDVLLTHKATIGRTAIVPSLQHPYIMLTPQVTYYRIKNKNILHNAYLKYYFDSKPFQDVLRSWSGSGSTRAYLGITDQLNLPVIILPITTQEKIADVLSALDAKIILNNRINEELQQVAKMLFGYWFVQFDFPDGNGNPYKTSGGKMEYSEELKKEIPKGWKVTSLYDIATYTNGLPMQKYRPVNGESLPVIKIKEMNEGYSDLTEFARKDIDANCVINKGDIIFSWSASLKVMLWADKQGALNQHIFKVTSVLYPRYFVYFQIVNYLNHFKLMAANRKTTMGHITIDHLEESRIVVPDNNNLIEGCKKTIEDILDLITKNTMQNHELSRLRDFLLPLLLNEQVEVS